MTEIRQTETLFSVSAQQAGETVLLSRLHLQQFDDDKLYGRFDAVAAEVSEFGSDLTFGLTDEGDNTYNYRTGSSFLKQQGVEVGFFDGKLNDGRCLPIELPPQVSDSANPQWLVHKTIRRNGLDKDWEYQWSVGREASITDIRSTLGKTGVNAEAIFNTIYYGLAISSGGDPLIYSDTMHDRTKAEINLLTQVDGYLAAQMGHSVSMLRLLQEPSSQKRPQSVEAEFVQARRQAHELETNILNLSERSAVNPLRVIIPTGQGKKGRTWPYMDASVEDEDASFGSEQRSIRLGSLSAPQYQLEAELTELDGRRDMIGSVIRSMLQLSDKEENTKESV